MDYHLLHPRDELVVTMSRIYAYRMTTTSGGNLSIRDENGDVWITPAGVDKGQLDTDDIVCIRKNGKIEGRHKPSSEYPFHLAVYAARPDLRAVVHAHPVGLVAFSMSRRTPDPRISPHFHHLCPSVGFAPYGVPGSKDLGRKIARSFKDGHDCVVLENHGVVTGGTDLQQAFQRFETLEIVAKTMLKAAQVGVPNVLDDRQLAIPNRVQGRMKSFKGGPITIQEKEMRKQLADFVKRGYRQQLMTSTAGSVSARLDGNTFLITPHPLDRYAIEPADLVLVRNGRYQSGGREPSRAAVLHRAIYKAHPDIRAVINAYPVNATAFGLCGLPVNTHTIPESYVFLREVSFLPFEDTILNPRALARAITPDRPAAVLGNNGVLVAGQSVLAAYDKLEVLEYTAEAIISCRSIGGPSAMPESVIVELKKAFHLP